jgi:hypothetical protein
MSDFIEANDIAYSPSDMIGYDEIINNESIFNDSTLFFMNPNTRGDEAYFGENNPLKTELLGNLEILREIYNRLTSTKDKTEVKAIITELEDACTLIGTTFKKHFNLERAYVGTFDGLNAFAMPMCYDKELVEVDEKNRFKRINKEHIISLEDIVETSNGFKYRKPKGKIFAIGLGLEFFEGENWSNEEIAGILLHECGHSFQQMLVGINVNHADTYISTIIKMIYSSLDVFNSGPIFNIFAFILSLPAIIWQHGLKNRDPEELGDEIIEENIGSDPELYNRNGFGEIYENGTAKDAKKINKKAILRKNRGPIGKFFIFMGSLILGTIAGVFITAYNILYPLIWILNLPQHIFIAGNMKFLKQNKRYEQFADMFAANYGLGKGLASGLAKLGKESQINLYTLNWLNYIPVLNLMINWGHYHELSIRTLVTGYPTMAKRVVGVYNTCKYELEHNTELSSDMKKELTQQLEDIEEIYDKFVFGKGARNFVYSFCSRVIGRNIKKESTDITTNVLEVLQELKEEKKLEELKKESEKKASVKLSLNEKIASLTNKVNIANSVKKFIDNFRFNNNVEAMAKKYEQDIKLMMD